MRTLLYAIAEEPLGTMSTSVFALLLMADPATLVDAAKRSGTDGLVLIRNGQKVAELTPTKRVHVQSVSKVMLNLAAGCLRTDGRLPSLDITVGEVLPELKADPKAPVTLRQLMGHVSGVLHPRNAKGNNAEEFKKLGDTRSFAFRQPLEDPPGTKRRYNNTGMIITGAMVERLAGEPLPKYIQRRLFDPMGIRTAQWMKDRAGNAFGYMGLVINAEDLAKLGQLVLDEGQWEGRTLIDREWMRESTTQAAYPGLSANQGLIWMFQGGEPGAPALIQHSGDGGNWLMILPKLRAVATRVRDSASSDSMDFPQMVVDLLRQP